MGSSVKLTLIANFKGAAQEMTQALKSVDSHVQKLTIDLKKVDAKAFNAFVTKTKLLGSAVRATRGPLQGAIAQQRALGREIEKNIRHGMDPASKRLGILKRRYVAVSMAVARLTQQKRDLAARTKELTRRTKEEARAMKQALDSAANYARYGLMAVVAAGGLLAYSMLKAASGIENAEAAFRPMLGSLMKAGALVGLINETAAKTPFQFEAISTSVKQLLPAVKGNMLGVIKTFRMLGDVSSGNAQRLDSVTRAYTKSMLRGQVDMRSMNMIARAGVPIFTELSKTMGVTVKELFKLSRAGEISSTDLTAAFQRMTSEGGMFHKGMEIASKTLSGRISTLKDNIMLLGVNLGNVLLPAAKAFVEVSLDVVSYLREITKDSMVARIAVDALAASFLLAAGSLTYVILAAKGAVIINTLTLAFKGLAVAMWANPFGFVVAGLAAITVAAGLVVRNWTTLEVLIPAALDRVQLKADIFIAEMKRDFEIFSVEVGAAFEHGLLQGVTRAFMAMSNHIASIARMFVGERFFLPGADRIAKYAEDIADKFKTAFPTSTRALEEVKRIEGTYSGVIDRLNKKSETFQKKTLKNLKDAKLALEAVAGGGIVEGQEQAPLADRLMGAGDKAAQREYNALQAVKAGLKERMKIYQIAKNKRIKFLLDEKARIRGLISISEKERGIAVWAAEDLITKIREEGSKKRVKLAKKSNDDMFKELLRGTVNDTQARRHKMEREAFKAHLEERMKIMQIAKVDEAAFLEREYERLGKASGLSVDQRVRAEEVASKMIIAIHKSTYKEMTKIIDDATSASDKKLMERLQRNTDKLNTVKDKTITATINMSERTAAIMGSFVNHTTGMVANAAKTSKFVIKDMVQSIAEDISKLMANRIISDFFMGIFGKQELKQNDMASIMGQLGGGLLGGMFGGPQVANGGTNALGSIATRRTLGIYGEAGPEAVMPLVRRNGVLGVGAPRGGGGGGGGTTVNIINNAGVEIEEEHSRNAFGGEEIKLVIRKAVRDDMNSGKFDSTFRSIGLPPRRGTSRG